MDERAHQRECGRPRIAREIQHLARREVFAGLRAKRGEIGVEATARDEQRNAPGETAGHEHDAGAEQRAGHAPADAVEQHEHQERHRQPHRLRSHADADRRRGRRRSRSSVPTPRSPPRVNRRSPSAGGRCRHHASNRQACAISAIARPGRSLIGRTARYQNNGQEAATAVAAIADTSSERHGALDRSRRSPVAAWHANTP